MVVIARIVIDIDETEIVTRDCKSFVFGHADMVNMGTILTSRVHTLDIPTKLARVSGPLHVFGVKDTSSILLLGLNIVVKLLVSTIARSDIG